MKQILELIEKGEFQAAYPKADKYRRRALSCYSARKAGLFVGALLLFVMLFCTVLNLMGQIEGADIALFLTIFAFLQPLIEMVNGPIKQLLASFEQPEELCYFVWIVLCVIVPAIASALIALVASLLVKKPAAKPLQEGTVPELAEQFKTNLSLSEPEAPVKGYAVFYAIAFVIVFVGSLAYASIKATPDEMTGEAYWGLAICIVLGFILFYFIFRYLLTTAVKLTELVTPSRYRFIDISEKMDAYLKKYNKEQEKLKKQRDEEAKLLEEQKKLQAEENARKLEAQRQLEMDAELAHLMEADPIDAEALLTLADKGHIKSCAMVGEILYQDYTVNTSTSAFYTNDEKKEVAYKSLRYLDMAADNGDIVSKALAISLKIQFESFNRNQFKEMLADVRKAKASGLLKPEYVDICDAMIPILVETIDKTPEPAPPPKPVKPREPVLKREYCAYCTGGTCGYYSTSYYLAKCDHLNDPGQCSAALNQKALRFEFE